MRPAIRPLAALGLVLALGLILGLAAGPAAAQSPAQTPAQTPVQTSVQMPPQMLDQAQGEQRKCLDCHRAPNLNTNEGVLASNAQCLECHAQESCRRLEGDKPSLQVTAESFGDSRHRFVACLQCHDQVGRSPHRSQAGASCSECHPPHGEATLGDPHLRVQCQACHHVSELVEHSPASGRVELARRDGQGRFLNLNDHKPPSLEDPQSCQRCHKADNQVGAAAAVLPAKGVICFLCHSASFSLGHWSFALALLILLLGMGYLAWFWLKGSVQGQEQGLHQKLALGGESLWRLVFSRRFWSVLGALLLDVILQRRLLKESVQRWFCHSLIYLSILARLGLGLFTWLVYQAWPDSALALALLDKNHGFVAFANDLLGLLILLGILLALLRRWITRPRYVVSQWQDAWALLIIGLLVIAGFVSEGARILLTGLDASTAWGSFGGYLTALLLSLFKADWRLVYPYLWWIHAGLGALLIAYLPFGKMRHVFATPLSLMLNRDLK